MSIPRRSNGFHAPLGLPSREGRNQSCTETVGSVSSSIINVSIPFHFVSWRIAISMHGYNFPFARALGACRRRRSTYRTTTPSHLHHLPPPRIQNPQTKLSQKLIPHEQCHDLADAPLVVVPRCSRARCIPHFSNNSRLPLAVHVAEVEETVYALDAGDGDGEVE